MSSRAIRVGSAPKAEGSSGLSFWKPKPDESADVTVLCSLNEVISVDQFSIWSYAPAPIWVSIGSDDPGYELGLKPSYKAFLPVAVKEDGVCQVKIWNIGIGIHRDLTEIADMNGDIEGSVLRVKRTGSGLSTQYTVMLNAKAKALKPDEDVPTTDDIIDSLGPEDREGILALLLERTGMSWERLVEKMTAPDDGVGMEEF